MNEEEPRYTEEEWKQKKRDERFVGRVHHALIGHRIESIYVLQRIMNEIHQVSDPIMFRAYELGRCIGLGMKDDEDE